MTTVTYVVKFTYIKFKFRYTASTLHRLIGGNLAKKQKLQAGAWSFSRGSVRYDYFLAFCLSRFASCFALCRPFSRSLFAWA